MSRPPSTFSASDKLLTIRSYAGAFHAIRRGSQDDRMCPHDAQGSKEYVVFSIIGIPGGGGGGVVFEGNSSEPAYNVRLMSSGGGCGGGGNRYDGLLKFVHASALLRGMMPTSGPSFRNL